VAGLAALLSKDFLKLVGLAFAVGAPPAYLVLQRWLEAFAYRIELGPRVFLLAGAVAFGVALLAVSTQAIRAALADPVRSLRHE
jgi:putative ABC transport system permease protein